MGIPQALTIPRVMDSNGLPKCKFLRMSQRPLVLTLDQWVHGGVKNTTFGNCIKVIFCLPPALPIKLTYLGLDQNYSVKEQSRMTQMLCMIYWKACLRPGKVRNPL